MPNSVKDRVDPWDRFQHGVGAVALPLLALAVAGIAAVAVTIASLI